MSASTGGKATADRVAAALDNWLETYVADRLADYDEAEDPDCIPDARMCCPACELSGCLQWKIRESRAALKAFRGEST